MHLLYKNVLLLFIVIFLVSCGGGGDTSVSGDTSGGSSNSNAPNQAIIPSIERVILLKSGYAPKTVSNCPEATISGNKIATKIWKSFNSASTYRIS